MRLTKELGELVRIMAFLVVYVLGSLYLAERLIAALELSFPFRLVAGFVVLLLAAAMPLALRRPKWLPNRAIPFSYLIGGLYLAWLMWGGLALVVADAVRLLAWAVGAEFPAGTGRYAALGIGGIIAVLTVYGTCAALSVPRTRHVALGIPSLPESLEGLTIAHLSDIHLGHLHRAARLRRVVEAVNAADPDLVVLTGDQADGDTDAFVAAAEPFAELRARFGVYAVNGNHEHYGDVDRIDAELSRAGITILINQWEQAAPNLVIAGLEDPTGRLRGEGANLDKALSGIPSEATVILLAHRPKYFDEACRRGVDLTLSGHTHGGQLWPWGLIVRRFCTYLAGYHRRGRGQLFVSNGVGTWGPPVRIGAAPEIVFYRLTRAEAGMASARLRRGSYRKGSRLSVTKLRG